MLLTEPRSKSDLGKLEFSPPFWLASHLPVMRLKIIDTFVSHLLCFGRDWVRCVAVDSVKCNINPAIRLSQNVNLHKLCLRNLQLVVGNNSFLTRFLMRNLIGNFLFAKIVEIVSIVARKLMFIISLAA